LKKKKKKKTCKTKSPDLEQRSTNKMEPQNSWFLCEWVQKILPDPTISGTGYFGTTRETST
jgi:hypothetical protein